MHKTLKEINSFQSKQINRLKSINNELVEALKLCEDIIGNARLQGKLSDNALSPVNDSLIKARQALSKVGV